MGLKLRHVQKLSTLQKFALVVGSAAMTGFIVYLLIIMNTAGTDKSIAGLPDEVHNDRINNGEILAAYTWDQNILKAEVGPDAVSASDAIIKEGALASGKGKDIALVINKIENFNQPGIDISIDFKRLEESGEFITRGSMFSMGLKKGLLYIKYNLTSPNNSSYEVEHVTSFEIPQDDQFRNYRFIYTPSTGKSEIFVDKVPVWNNQAVTGSSLTWKPDDPLIIGKGINGGSTGKPVIDNLIIRSTGVLNSMPFQLLSFSAEVDGKDIVITWHTSAERVSGMFTIEKSTDSKNFTTIGKIPYTASAEPLKTYKIRDENAIFGVTFYRLSSVSAKKGWSPVIAFRLKPEMLPNTSAEKTE